MKTKIIILCICFASGINYFAGAQVGNYLKAKQGIATRRAGQQVDKEVNKEITDKVDKGVSDIFDKLRKKDGDKPETGEAEPVAKEQPSQSSDETSSKKSSGNSANDAMGRAMMSKMGINMGRPANIKDKYDYSGNLLMTVETWDEDGKSDGEVLYTTHYTSDNKGYAMDFKSKDKGDSRMIFDYENQVMIILGDNGKDKSGMVMAIGPNVTVQDSAVTTATTGNTTTTANSNVTDYNSYYSSYKKTGQSKKISGYNCDEYVYEDAENKASYWMTNDLSADLWANMFNSYTITAVYAGRPNGFIMEWNNESKASKQKSHMVVKEVNKNQSSSFSTIGYTFMSFNSPQTAPKEKK
jgi:hypothetical protein